MTLHWPHLDIDSRVAAIVDLRDAGRTKSEIAAALNTTINPISGFCFRQSIEGVQDQPRKTGGWYDLTTKEKVAAVRSADAAGNSAQQIAEIWDISVRTLQQFCWRNGLSGISVRRVSTGQRRDDQALPAYRYPGAPIFEPAEEVDPAVWQPLADPVSFLENTGCAWPVDTPEGQACCGRKRSKGSYCAEHRAIAYRGGRQVDERTIAYLAGLDARGKAKAVQPEVEPAREGKKTWSYEDE